MKNQLFTCCMVLLSSFLMHAQQLNEIANDALVVTHEELAMEQRMENIYIHTDKDIYEPGEDLWFKAYILDAQELMTSTTARIVFVKLMKLEGGKKTMIVQEKYEVRDGYASGYLFLAQTLKSGNYQLEMHTKNTIESISKELRAVKRFEIKESIIPKILMDVEFSKKTYTRSEAVIAEVNVFSRSRVPYANIMVTAILFAGTEKLNRMSVRTNEKGIALLNFPAKESKRATNIQLRVKYKGQRETTKIDIPFETSSKLQFGIYPEGGSLVANLSNTVAFKALDVNGRPLQVKGNVLENGKKIHEFSAEHYGMGKFTLTPKPDKKYTVQLSYPKIDSIFQFPEIQREGVKLQVQKRDKNHIYFEVKRSQHSIHKKIYIRAQNRGLVYWMATASLENERVQFKLPLEELPQGIAEITIFDDNFLPLAERLVYANLDQKLHISVKEISKSTFKQKEKVNITFSIKDENLYPTIANLSLSIYDHLYAVKTNDYAMMPHYYLFSELKGHVYDASYYFDEKHKNRAQHLDLLMLTQGWRNYFWNNKQFIRNHKKNKFYPYIRGQVFIEQKNGRLIESTDTAVQVAYPDAILQMKTDNQGTFELPVSSFKKAQGSEITIISSEKENIFHVKAEDPFDNLNQFIKFKSTIFPDNDLPLQIKEQSSYDRAFSFTETNYLDEVNLSSYKEREEVKLFYGYKFYPSDTDYVCFEYHVINCPNHRSGYKPVNGEVYFLIDGGLVEYNFEKYKQDREKKQYVKIRGMYPEKEFYNPMYDKKPDDKLLPDNRKTLFWAPNLVSNTKGEITIEFYTSDVQTTFLGKLEGTDGFGLLGSHTFQIEVK